MAAGSQSKGRHKRYQCELPVLCIAPRRWERPGVLRPPCSQPFDGRPFGPGNNFCPHPNAPGHERRFVSTFIPPGKKASVQAGCLPRWLGRDAVQPPLCPAPHGDGKAPSFSQSMTYGSAWLAASRSRGCSPPAACPVPPGWDMWPGPGTTPGAKRTGGANKQIFLGVRKLSEMLVFSVSLSFFFCDRLPSRGFCTSFYSHLRFGAADWM